MKRVALAAVAAALSLATAAPALADNYDDAVAAQVGKLLSYPQVAADRDIEGRVGVKVEFDGQGRVANVALERSSHVGALDRAAVAAVRRIVPTVQTGAGEMHTLHLYVNYKLI